MKVENKMSANTFKKNNLILAQQPYHDEFLHLLKNIFKWSRIFGVSGNNGIFWKAWGFLLFTLLLAIGCGSVWKLIKVLAGWASNTTGHRSVAARISGAIFYACSIAFLFLIWRLSLKWTEISNYWADIEQSTHLNVPKDEKLKSRIYIFIMCVIIFTVVEHGMSMASLIGGDCPPDEMLKKYILRSHAFLLLKNDYNLWLAIPILLMSNVATVLWNLQAILIVVISKGLTSRYNRLNTYVEKLGKWDKVPTGQEDQEALKLYTWRKVRQSYVKQSSLVKKVDKAISGLILLSNFGDFYFICLQLFLGVTLGFTGTFLENTYYLVSMCWLCVRLSCVVLAAADVNVCSKRALQYLHECPQMYYNIEVERLQNQLDKDVVALSGMGFYLINRTILLEMAGAIITYELVLIQFDK